MLDFGAQMVLSHGLDSIVPQAIFVFLAHAKVHKILAGKVLTVTYREGAIKLTVQTANGAFIVLLEAFKG